MLRPSTAPRWKMAISSRLRAVAASAARARNAGAKPSDTIAIAPDLMKRRRVVMAYLVSTTKVAFGDTHESHEASTNNRLVFVFFVGAARPSWYSSLPPLELRCADRGRRLRAGDLLRDVHARDQ